MSIPHPFPYDGRTGARQYGQILPDSLGLTHIEINAGRSSQATLLGRSARTYESLYLSPALAAQFGLVQSLQSLGLQQP
jgi:DNA adenine methylase